MKIMLISCKCDGGEDTRGLIETLSKETIVYNFSTVIYKIACKNENSL